MGNFIQSLKSENAALKDKSTDATNICNELLRYMNSEKFHCGNELDGYINTSDVQAYLMRIKESLL